MPVSGEEEISSCNDEPEAEAHCNQAVSNQSLETEQAVNQDTEEKASSAGSSDLLEGNSNLASLDSVSIRRRASVEGAHCLPTRKSEEINEIMTFSDAEEDQPNKKENSRGENNAMNTVEETNGAEIQEERSASSCSSQDNEPVSQRNEPSPKSKEPLSQNDQPSSSQNNGVCPVPNGATSASSNSAAEDKEILTDDVIPELDEDLNSEKVMKKLKQIQSYINQTSNAMKALEQEGNMNKLEQFSTLAKVLKDLKTSKEKLVRRLIQLKENNDYSTDITEEHGNSKRMGVVGSMNEVVNPLSMQERLARHETEQGILSARLRESVAKREELVSRYKNTRDRLSNLKKQRQGIIQEERSLLQSHGASDDPYESPIPEADTWTVEQLKQAVVDFEGLKNKVIHLKALYDTQTRTVDVNDEEALEIIRQKKEQILLKGGQIDEILTQLKALLRQKGGQMPLENGCDAGLSEVEGAIERNEDLTGAVAIGEALSASTDDILASSDVVAKQEHLNKLKAQLNNMKTLLDETQSIRLANVAELERRKEIMEVERRPDILMSAHELHETDLLTFNGQCLRLSDDQLANPEIFAKSQQLREAKQRLAKMEEVMDMIATARDQNKPLNEVLTPEYMAILEDAQNELESPLEKNQHIQIEETVHSPQPQPSIRQIPARSDPESDHETTAMEIEPVRNPPISRAVNERQSENMLKSVAKKQNRNIWNDGAANSENPEPAADVNITELLNLQQDLRQKKNNLEDLMNRVGKSSAFLADNISVNISDGNSDTEEVQRSWNDPTQHQSFRNVDDRADVQGVETRSSNGRILKQNTNGQKNENKFSAAQLGGVPPSGLILPPAATINNFNPSQGVRPKAHHPFEGARPPPNVTWEVPRSKQDASLDNSNEDVQNMMSSALSQLNGLQQTVNHLYDTMRQIKPQPMEDRMAYPSLPASYPPLHMYSSFMPPTNMSGMCGPYGYSYAPRNNDANSQGHVMGALHQCLSQLQLQSMEIQSLNKQLQTIEQKEKRAESIGKNRGDEIHESSFRIRQPEGAFPSFRFSGPEPSSIREDVQTNGQTASYSQARRLSSFPRVSNVDDLDFGNQNFYPPFDGCVSTDNSANTRMNRPRTMQMQEPATAYVAVQPLQPQSSTSILNNKVLPGTRANNYWDNFRSYSHQNPLSSTRKSNSRGDNFSGPIQVDPRKNSRTKEPIQAYPNRLHENRRQNVTSRRNDHVNRASEKNSSYGTNRGTSRGNFPADVIIPEPQYPTVRLAKNENRIEDRFFQPTVSDSGFVPSFPPSSNLQLRSFDDFRSSRSFLRGENPDHESRSEVMRQAEDLLKKQHPRFLLKLFSYLSKITDNTDQHVALELLKELSNQDPNFHNHWMSSFSSLNNDDYHPSLVQNSDQVRKNEPTAAQKAERNLFSNSADLELSEAFNCIGEDIQVQAKEPYDVYKNLAAGGLDHVGTLGRNQVSAEKSPSVATTSTVSSFYTPLDHCPDSLWKRSKDHVNFFDTSCRVKDKSPDLSGVGSLDPTVSLVESNSLSFRSSPNVLSGRGKPIQAKSMTTLTDNSKKRNTLSASNASHVGKEFTPHVANSFVTTKENTFDSIISAVFRKIMDYFKSMADTNEPSDMFLEGLHLSILRVIEGHTKKSYSPELFASIANRLKRTLHSFKGKRISEIQQELPAAVSQVLIHQYCSHLYHENTESFGAACSTDYFIDPNNQSNLSRQRNHQYANSDDVIDGGIITNRSAKQIDETRSGSRKSTSANFDRSRLMDTGSKLTANRHTNSKINRPANQKRFDLVPIENDFYIDSRMIDSPVGDEPEGSFYGLRSNEANKVQWNNVLLPIRTGDSTPIHQLNSLPVHDLAEADQTRDKPHVEDLNSNEAAGLVFEMCDFAGGYSNPQRQEIPEQGLDEVPTKLRSPLEMPGFDDDDDLPEAFEDAFRH